MTNIYFSGDKAPAEEAIAALKAHVKGVCDLVFAVRTESDDGGRHLTLYLEVEEPSKFLPPYIKEALQNVQWMGWRFMILKVPPGMIEVVFDEKRGDW
tara:strand:+ start:7982 stop:8275 length:294 start_codon:yes stop_codon:yes gene_type:complete